MPFAPSLCLLMHLRYFFPFYFFFNLPLLLCIYLLYFHSFIFLLFFFLLLSLKGFETIEYTASALVDQSLHKLTADEISTLDLAAFEEKELGRLGMPKGIVMRHRPAHFQRKMTCVFCSVMRYSMMCYDMMCYAVMFCDVLFCSVM